MSEVIPMILPKHNVFLRWLYIVGVIGMFIFMSMVIWSYLSEGTADSNADSSANYNSQILSQVAEYYSSDLDNKNNESFDTKKILGLVEQPEVSILVKKFELNLNQIIENQMSAFWLLLFDDNVMLSSKGLITDKTVYQVYRNYDPTKNVVDVLLGFKVNDSVSDSDYEILTLEAGLMLPRKSVLDSWQNYEQLPIKLVYELDFEVFQLDERFNVISQKAFLNPRGDNSYE